MELEDLEVAVERRDVLDDEERVDDADLLEARELEVDVRVEDDELLELEPPVPMRSAFLICVS